MRKKVGKINLQGGSDNRLNSPISVSSLDFEEVYNKVGIMPVTVITAGGIKGAPALPKVTSKHVDDAIEEGKSTARINKNSTEFELVPLDDSGAVSDDVVEPEIMESVGEEDEELEPITASSVDKMTDQLLNDASKTLSVEDKRKSDIMWLLVCFFGVMFSFVLYGLLLEYTTSGGRKLHELSFLFITSLLYTITAACGSYVRDETPTTIPRARFAVLGMTSMGSTFCSVRSLRYVIYPIQVLAKSCKPVPVMLMGALMGKKYPLKKYINVVMIVGGVGLFMGGGGNKKKSSMDDDASGASQLFGIILLFISLCFDGGTGAYEDKLMSVHSVGPFDLMYNIQLGKTILAGVGLIIFNQVHVFLDMVQEMGFLLVALGLSGAIGQVFIFITIAKFGALTCSIIGLARKVTTLVASIYFYGHVLNSTQSLGLVVCISAMILNFMGKGAKGGHGHGHGGGDGHKSQSQSKYTDEVKPILSPGKESSGDVELGAMKK